MATTLEIILRAQNRLSGELKKVNLELKAIQASVLSIQGSTGGATRGLKGLGNSLAGASAQANALRTTLLAFGGIALFVGAVRTIAKFEQSMANVRAIMLTVGDAAEGADEKFAALNAEARRLGGTTIFTASQAAEGLLFLGRAGFSAQQSLESLEGTLALAAAGNIGLSQAADIATNVMAGFGLAAEEAGRVADVLAFTAASANTDVIQLGDAMKFVAPIAAALAVPVDDAAAAIGILSNAGLKASLAGTGLRKVLVKLASPTKKLRKVMKGLGIEIDQIDVSGPGGLARAMELLGNTTFGAVEAIDLFGDRGAPAALAMANMSDELKRLTEETHEMENAALDMAKVMTDTLTGSFKLFISAIQEAIIATGDGKNSFGANLRGIVDSLAGMIRVLNDTQDPMHENAVLFQTLANGAKFLFVVLQGLIAVKLVQFLIAAGIGIQAFTIRMKGAIVTALAFKITLLGLRTAFLAALGPIGWVALLGIAFYEFSVGGAKDAVDVLRQIDGQIDLLRVGIERLTAKQLRIETETAIISLKKLEDEAIAVNKTLRELKGKGLAGRGKIGQDLRRRKSEIETEIILEEEKIKLFKKITTKKDASELVAKKALQDKLRKLEGTRDQARTSAVIAARKLDEEVELARLDTALRFAKQKEKEGVSILKAELDKKTINIETYYANVKALGNRSLDAEIAIEQKKVDVVKKANADKIADLESEEGAAIKGTNTQAELDAVTETFIARRIIVDAQNAEALLEDGESLTKLLEQRAVINADFDSREAIALQTKLEKDAAAKKKAAATALKKLKDDLKDRLDAIRLQAELERDEIGRRSASGELSFIQSDQALVQVNETEIAALQTVLTTYTALNEQIKDPDVILSLDAISERMLALGRDVPPGLAKIQAGLVDGITEGLIALADGTKTAKEAFQDLARSFLAQIARMIAQQIALNIVRAAFGGFSGGGSAAAAPGAGTPFVKGGVVKAATGGYITGSGTSTSDSIPARLSSGEYVVQAKAVRHYGLNFVEALNRMALDSQSGLKRFAVTRPRRASFAEGGIVDSGAGTKDQVPQISSLRIINVLDSDESIENFMASSSGEAIVLNHMRRNSSVLRSI